MAQSLRRAVLGLAAAVIALGACDAGAYTVRPTDVLVRLSSGASVNAVRYDAATRATPGAGLALTADVDFALDGPLALTGRVAPVFAPDFVDIGLGLGVRYRGTALNAPFIPWGGATVTAAFGVPTARGATHVNLGLRPAAGVDYFIMRDLYVGLEMAIEGSVLTTPDLAFETTAEALLGVGYRF